MTEQGWVEHRTGLGAIAIVVLVCAANIREAAAHPAHAEPVNYPYVVGFERFHSGLDDEDYLAEGGFLLLNELNCVACHAPPDRLSSAFEGVEATRLDGVASRLAPVDLELMIRNPRFLKQDTVMPGFFSGRDRDPDEIVALKHYLAGSTAELPVYPEGDIDAGRVLYHRIGCAGCHAPEVGYRPPGLPENAEIELAGLPSVPMNLADRYSLTALTGFLLDPLAHRPSGRMPDFQLSEKDACNLAAYLKAGPDLVLPENVIDALGDEGDFAIDPALAVRGAELFVSKNCTACHTMPGGQDSRTLHRAKPLAQLVVETRIGCLAERPVGGAVPFYGLDEVQKRAIVAALVRLPDRQLPSPAVKLDQRLKRLNCYACHERGGVGGPETAREVYFGFESEKAIDLGRAGHLPPPLEGTGAKLTDDWLSRVLAGDPKAMVRPWLSAKMPVYHSVDTEPIAEAFMAMDRAEESSVFPPPTIGGRQRGEKGFTHADGDRNCADCHEPSPAPGPAMLGTDLRSTEERLRWPWFQQLGRQPVETLPTYPDPHAFGDGPEAVDLWRFLTKSEP